ncbi:MAG: CBS domain-containing protein [Chloroflexi bacterium]|jgi:hypothetical protein|nr:CBS domain-containing protein [Chloroflexota bacterium]
MNEVIEFLDLYNKLEQVLKGRGSYYNDRYESPVLRYQNSAEGKRYREEIETIRAVRNLLVHVPLMDGTNPVTPSPSLNAKLREIVNSVQNSKTAIDLSTWAEHLITATLDSNVYDVMRTMESKGFSHVPVMNHDRMMGVFSKGTFFTYTISKGFNSLSPDITLAAMRDLLPVRNHSSEYYEFAAEDTSKEEIVQRFDVSYKRNRSRLAAIFVTRDGNPNQELLGMITPWDVLGDKS